MRMFEKISYQQFKNDISNNKKLYEEYNLPKRNTRYSAGYDFYAIEEINIKPGEIKKIPTGVKVCMNNDEMLMMVVRSSYGFKYNIRLTNQVGIIDSDYYDNINNEGHLWVCMQNHSDKLFTINKGDKFVQGIFTKYLTVDNEKEITEQRKYGFGSTGKGDNNE